jgi:hypothetical protein
MFAVGCAARGPVNVSTATAAPAASTARSGEQPPPESLESFMAKVRKISTEARPTGQPATTFEARYPTLSAAAAVATFAPSPMTLRAAAEEYRRAGIFDKALNYLTRALALNQRDAVTLDLIARLWRDSGLPQVAIGDAHRAVFSRRRIPWCTTRWGRCSRRSAGVRWRAASTSARWSSMPRRPTH